MKMKISIILCLVLLPLFAYGQEYQLVWSDEFEGDSLDETKWSYQIGTGEDVGLTDWGNNEKQYYRKENASVADGMLTITAKQETYGGKSYTSARIRTFDRCDWECCRVEFRAKMPIGKGLWAAIWMLPTDAVYGGWASSGEIDMLEYLGHEPNKIHGTLHFGGKWPNNASKGQSYTLASGDFHNEFHDFVMEWEDGKFQWYVDGILYQTQASGWWSSGGAFPAPFDERFHLLINLAVGGNWPGSPDSSTEFPQELVLDYIRIYQKDATGMEEQEIRTPSAYKLEQNYPNPFYRFASISFSMPKADHVILDVMDATGRYVETVVYGEYDPGRYTVDFDGSKFPPGMYTYTLRTGGYFATRQMLMLGD